MITSSNEPLELEPIETAASNAGEPPSDDAEKGARDTIPDAPSSKAFQKRRKKRPSFMKIVRRVHLFLGLLLMPWILLFGITALSFNHPTVGRGLNGRMLRPSELKELTGVEAWDAANVASTILKRMNASGQSYRMVPDSAKFQGWPLFASEAKGGKEVVILGLDRGMAILTKRKAVQESARPPFFQEDFELGQYAMKEVAQKLAPIHSKLDIKTEGPLRPHPKVHPQLRFQLLESGGKSWNVTLDLSSGLLDGRPTDEDNHAPFVEVLESLHTQHHYPANFGPTFFWALFSDLTALTLLLWAMSGLLMWLQMKKLRLVGIVFLLTAGVLAILVMGATSSEQTFGPERASH